MYAVWSFQRAEFTPVKYEFQRKLVNIFEVPYSMETERINRKNTDLKRSVEKYENLRIVSMNCKSEYQNPVDIFRRRFNLI